MQTIMLNCVGLLHGSNEHSRDFALDSIGELVNISTREGLLCASTQSRLPTRDTSQDARWATWVEDETRKRTGYFIWVRYKN